MSEPPRVKNARTSVHRWGSCLVFLLLFACGDSGDEEDVDASLHGPDAAGATDARQADGAAGDATIPVDAGRDGVTSTLIASGCPAEFSSSRVLVHYNTSLGIVFTDPDSPYTVRGTISFDFPSTFTGAIPNPYSWVDSGIHKEVAVTDDSYTTWGNHCWQAGDLPTGGSATIAVIDGPDGVVQASFQGLELRNCVSRTTTCTLTGSIESVETGVFE